MAKPLNVAKTANVWIGAETGLLKSVDIVNKVATNHFEKENYGKDHEICTLCWNGETKAAVFTAHKNGIIREFNIEKGEFVGTVPVPDIDIKNEHISQLCCIDDNFLTCLNSGKVQLWNVAGASATILAGKNVLSMDYSHTQSQVATGGKENLLKVWDLNKPELPVFKAKNVPLDWLQHRVPVWVTNIRFIPGESKIITTTGTHSIRVYDLKNGPRRPVAVSDFSEFPIRSVGLVPQDLNKVIVGNTRGEMAQFDFRKLSCPVRCYKGFAGSIRGIVCHSNAPYIFSCGLDRYLRVHRQDQPKPVHKVYLKSRLNSLLVADLPVEKIECIKELKKNKTLKNEVLGDDLWQEMDTISDSEKDTDSDDSNVISPNDNHSSLHKKRKVR